MNSTKLPISTLLVALASVAFLSLPIGAQPTIPAEPQIIKLSSTLWSDLRDVKFSESRAFCLLFDGLAVLDLYNINSPSQIAQLELPSDGRKLAVSGDLACVASADSFLYLIDIQSLDQPTLTDSFKLPDQLTGIEVRGNCIFAVAKDAGLLLLDATDPFEVAVIGSCRVEGFQPLSLCLHENLAYLAGIGGLRLINVLVPQSPFLFGSSEAVPGGTKVYVETEMDRTYAYLGNPSQLSIVDVTDPRDILPLSVYVPESAMADMAILRSHAYLGLSYQGLVVLDVKERTSPIEVAALALGDSPRSVFSCSHFALVTDNFDPASIVNVFNPDRPFVAGKWIFPGTPEDVAISGDFSYVLCSNSGIHLLNVEDPENPQMVSNFYAPYNNNDIEVEGSSVYFTALLMGMQILDFSDPLSPAVIGRYRPEGYTYGLSVQEGYAYLRNSGNGIQILDLENPAEPLSRGSAQTPGKLQEIAVHGNYLYAADLDAGLSVVDISDKDAPQVTGSILTPGACRDVFCLDTLLFLVCENAGVEIFSISDPAAPDSIGIYSTGKVIEDLYAENQYAYLSTSDHTVEVIELSSPSSPSLAASYGVLDGPGNLTVRDGSIYLCDRRSFKILKFLSSAKPPKAEAQAIKFLD